MHHHRALSLAAALFVMPFAAGCVAGGEDVGDEVVEVEGPGLSESYHVTNGTNLSCFHQSGYGMRCIYTGGTNGLARWQYDYSNTWGLDGPSYLSGDDVNWGHCQDPGSVGAPFSFTIHVQAWDSNGNNPGSLSINCK
ncbi:hypothetical protein [Polyangium mundeleinium]|uniref:Secreted protein n=1 Tax=Polyangium mundeleinium TaxID=2995306 RepID=A0ABT5EKD8_9BACT|nr:hypothetical protein [Polyangium mundeleinium]MDC0741939.1 hypothetical protein [Polyangium mundeleinium]